MDSGSKIRQKNDIKSIKNEEKSGKIPDFAAKLLKNQPTDACTLRFSSSPPNLKGAPSGMLLFALVKAPPTKSLAQIALFLKS